MTLEDQIREVWTQEHFSRSRPGSDWLIGSCIEWDDIYPDMEKHSPGRTAAQLSNIEKTKNLIRENWAEALTSPSRYVRDYVQVILKEVDWQSGLLHSFAKREGLTAP